MSQAPGASVTRTQSFFLQGVFSAVIVGIALPVGLTAAFLLAQDESAGDAIRHGELFFAGGNAGMVGCISLMAARQAQGLNAAIVGLMASVAFVGPCYAFAAYFSAQAISHHEFSEHAATIGGAVVTVIGAAFALIAVWCAGPTLEHER